MLPLRITRREPAAGSKSVKIHMQSGAHDLQRPLSGVQRPAQPTAGRLPSDAAPDAQGSLPAALPRNTLRVPLQSITLYPVILLYVIFNYGSSQLRLPLAGDFALPLGETVVVLLLALSVITHTSEVLTFLKSSLGWLLSLWWLTAILSIGLALDHYGIWAFRTATNAIDAVVIILGVLVGGSLAGRERFFFLVGVLLLCSLAYAMTFPWSEAIMYLSPKITSLSGQEIPIIGYYSGINIFVMWFVASIILSTKKVSLARGGLALAALFVAMVFLQNRTSYMMAGILLLMVAILFRRRLMVVMAGVLAIVIVLFVMQVFNIQLEGRVGQITSFNSLIDHFLSSFGGGDEFAGSGRGVDLRLGWWTSIVSDVFSSPFSLLFGLGQGVALTDFHYSSGILVREPHNSLISILARYGLVGLGAFLGAHVLMYRRLLSLIGQSEARGDHVERSRLVSLLFFFLAVAAYSMVEDGFEKPFIAIPYFMAWGVAIAVPKERTARGALARERRN